jgi:spermidine synthase
MPAVMISRNAWRVAALLFFSGLCALVYQTVWLRQFRLIFGASTFATGAVLAIFMGGLGIGSAILGKRADLRERPLLFYGNLEVMIAIAAALSQPLLWLAAKVYFASGGSPQLGIAMATLLRLFLATLVLGPATFLMGATLPAAARAVATEDDGGRHSVALLYGVNTLGAVAGALLSTFVMLETYGSHHTLLIAMLVNVLVGILARSMGRSAVVPASGLASQEETAPVQPEAGQRPALQVYVASALVGFAFLLMELVWYRMLSPILGGTTYMFGLILAVALFGIGVGGALYALARTERATAGAFAITCSLEALVIAIPFALGDRLAILANVLRDFGVVGFGGHVAAWTLITMIVVWPAACVAGYQFPLLIALLGRGSKDVGRQIGAAYAWNTGGAIVGSLAGGFGILPLLSAPGTWRLVAVLLTALAAAAVVLAFREREIPASVATIALGIVAVACAASTGPTAVWRHSGIGAARAPQPATRNDLEEWIHDTNRTLLWDKDGRESSIGVLAANDLVFFVNGKSDGAARGDAQTQVMSGLIGAILHPAPRKSLVIGLGTGSTAGWLARVSSMERVDAVELEPVVLEFARACAAVNAGAMNNPRVHITVADAREFLLTADARYDLIVSEPSNPYRAGIASLYTHEFYEAAEERLAPGGFFMQWMQSYAIHTETMQTVYATLTSVFPHVQTWRTSSGDMLLVAARDPIPMNADALRTRLRSEPFRTALHNVWRVDSLEQFLAHMVANESYAQAAAGEAAALNTDDRTVIEFGFARSIDERSMMIVSQISAEAEAAGRDRPVGFRGAADWNEVAENRLHRYANATRPLTVAQLSEWALAAVETGDSRTQQYIAVLEQNEPIEADVIKASLAFRERRPDESIALLQRAFMAYRANPWPHTPVMQHAIGLAIKLGDTSPARARAMFDALEKPFAVRVQDNYRRYALVELAPLFDGCGPATLRALRDVEPHPFWTRDVLTRRAVCYQRANLSDLADDAERDLRRFQAAEATPVIRPPDRQAPRGSS